MELDATQHFKVKIKGKVDQFREWVSALQHLFVVDIKKGTFWSPST